MSWLSKNYEKAALGGATVVALGLGYLGWSKIGAVETDFSNTFSGTGKGSPAVAGADLLPKAEQSMGIDRSWTQGIDPDGERPVDLFTGVPLVIKSSEPDKAIDPIKGDLIHPPIPNTWWLENRIDPGFADSPARDPDGDGFSNLEEFQAKTDPNNPKSVPALLAKLKFVKDETLTWALRPTYGSEGAFPFNYADSRRQTNRMPAGEYVKPNETFFPKGPMAGRFKLLGSETRMELNKRINEEMEITYVRIEDQKENKKGKVYEIPAPLSEERMNEYAQYDRSAIFSLEALGEGGKEFKIEENTPFALPPSSDKKDYLLKEVTPDKVVVDGPDGKGGRATVEIPKGAMPAMP
jgi:hypothetical protein